MPAEHTQASRARIGGTAALTVVAPFIAEADAATARAKARAALSVYMPLDYYRREWRNYGFTEADFAAGGSDQLIDALVAWGDETKLNERIAAHARAGATRVVVVPLALTSRAGLNARVLEVLAPTQGIAS